MVKQYNKPAVLKASERLDKLLSFILSNSEADEEWAEIKWADSYYYVSSYGRVMSLCNKQPHIMKPFMCNGYLCVSIYGYDRRINRLVAQAFIDNPEDKPIVHHRDTNRRNNKASNLQWMTEAEHAAAHLKINQERKKQREQPRRQ